MFARILMARLLSLRVAVRYDSLKIAVILVGIGLMVYGILSVKASPGSSGSFGKTDIGGDDYNIENKIVGSKYTIPEDGTVDNITVYLEITQVSHMVKCGIYNSTLDGFIAGTEEKDVAVTAGEWITFEIDGTKPNLTEGTAYYLVVWVKGTTGYGKEYEDAAEADQQVWASATYNSWPGDISGASMYNVNTSIFANYTSLVVGTTTVPVTTTTVPPKVNCTFNATHNTSWDCGWYCNMSGSNSTKTFKIYGGPGVLNFTDHNLSYERLEFNATDCNVTLVNQHLWNLTP